jgi:hypothetical protein
MDEGVLPSDFVDTAGLEELRQYGVADARIRQPELSASKTRRFETTSAFGAAGLSDGSLPSLKTDRTSPSLDVHHASPLTPLRKRDRQALDNFFESDRIQEIALDIHRHLARMYPEPCWEDEPYEFLRGYI